MMDGYECGKEKQSEPTDGKRMFGGKKMGIWRSWLLGFLLLNHGRVKNVEDVIKICPLLPLEFYLLYARILPIYQGLGKLKPSNAYVDRKARYHSPPRVIHLSSVRKEEPGDGTFPV